MSKTWRKLLSVLLALSMIVSLTVTGYATGNSSAASPTKASSGTKLELEEIDPGTLNVPRLGQITEDEEPGGEELPYKFGDIVRVSIVLDKAPTLEKYSVQNVSKNVGAVAYRAGLKHQQEILTSKIEATLGRKIDVKWNLTLAMNAISANVRYGDIAMIRTVEGVKSVELENRYEPQADEINTANTTEYMVGATALWENGYTGAGSRVAIIDTGTDQDHQSFDPEALEYALAEDGGDYNLLTWDEISGLAGQLNAPVTEGVYKNAKIPYAYNYVDGNYITDHMSDTQGEHGSHVSGIAAANRYVKIDGEYVDAASKVFAVGVAPDAQILTMKVFGKGGGAYDSDYMVAIEDAIVMGCDSINLSLGSSVAGFTLSNGYQETMNSLVECGSVVSISSGNSGTWADSLPSGIPYLYLEDVGLHTGGSPGSFTNALTVASADNTGIVGSPLVFNGTQTGYPSETSGYGNEPITTLAGNNTYDYVLVDGPGVIPLTDADNDNGETAIGDPTHDAFAALGRNVLSGKVAMCYRGTSSFYVKANAAAAQGAAAVIIINNQPGVINMNLSGYKYTAPAVSILKAVGDAVKGESTPVTDEAGNVLYYTGTMTIGEKCATATADRSEATISSFSSWGVPGSLILKPEITTPGGSIYSVWGANKGTSSPTDSHEDYELMSGTSMAAPHAAGMAALLGQFIRENNLEEVTGVNRRTLINSLLMGTATPMKEKWVNEETGEEGLDYISILAQGAGLGETNLATQAMSFITMNEDATASWQDGKVKVELGQDAKREGVYTYSFNINNFSDIDLTYELNTDMFIQGIAGADRYGNLFMDTKTAGLELDEDYTAEYDYPTRLPNDHDVNVDGETNKADAQAILDKLTGEYDENAAFDAKAADMDGDGKYTSYDAHLLLAWLEEMGDDLKVPAHESVTVNVTITYTDDLKEYLDYYYTGGTYVEGFTYVTPTTESADGAMLDVEQSIPILGFYGSWTDASMFDCLSAIDKLYGSTKVSYTDNPVTNYLTVNYGNGNYIYCGNPYGVEKKFPADRLAMNTNTKLVNFRYNLIRNAATSGWLAMDENFNILGKGNLNSLTYAPYYYPAQGTWQNNSMQTESIGGTVGALGLNEDDTFTLGYFAIPEYYGMMLHPDDDVNTVTAEEIAQLLSDGELGEGAYLGYTFTVDNTAPEAEAELSEDGTQVIVTAKDNNYVAYVAIMDVTGNVEYYGEVPTQNEKGEEIQVTIDVSKLDLPNGVAIFVGDYAHNETAKLIIFDPEKPVTATKLVYMLTDELEAGKDYVIANSNAAGNANALASQGQDYSTSSAQVTIISDSAGTYIDPENVQDNFVWTTRETGNTTAGFEFDNKDDGGALGFNKANVPYVSWSKPEYADAFLYQDSMLMYAPYASYGYGMYYDSGYFMFGVAAPVYLYTPVEVEIEMDPTVASSVTVNPAAATLIMDVIPNIQLTATVEPIVLTDRTVTWTSSNEEVATVDGNGKVTAVAPGTAIITATSNQTPEVYGTATINVTNGEPMNAVTYGQVAFGKDDVRYCAIDLSNMSTENLSGDKMFSAFYGGGRSGDFIYGNDVDNDFHRYNAKEEFSYDEDYHFVITPAWAQWDIACFPSFTIADYSTMDDDAEAPDTYEYPYILTGFNSTNKLGYFDEEGNITYFDLSELGNFVAVSFLGVDINEETELPRLYYALLADDGTLYYWIVYPNLSNNGMSAEYDVIGHVNVLTIGEDKSAYSMCYYEDPNNEDVYGVFIADSSIGGIYFVNLGEVVDGEVDAHFVGRIDGATSLTSLSDFYYDTIGDLGTIRIGLTSGGDSLPGYDIPASLRNIRTSGVTLESQTLNMLTPDAVNKGGLNSFKGTTSGASDRLLSAVALDKNASTEETKVVNITEDVDVTNGKYVVTYDPEKLTYVSAECDHEIKSIHVDEEKGEITLAFADTDAVAAGETLATVTFTVACEDTEITVTTNERNDELELDETETIAIEGIGHDWGEPEWTWAEDYSTATATFVCGNNDEHVEEIEAVVTSETTDPTCTEAGETVYTATVTFEGKEYTDTKTESIEATGHDWGEPTWTWSDDNKTVTATFVCNNDESHTMTVEATVTEETTEPTCTEDGTITYTATVTGPDGKEYTDTNADTLPAKGHVWGEPVWTWSSDHKTATATFTCTECGETVTVTDSAILTDTTEDGKITYTASVIGPDGKTYTTTFVGGVDTGDTMNLSLYIGLMLVSAAGAIVLLRTLKKKEN